MTQTLFVLNVYFLIYILACEVKPSQNEKSCVHAIMSHPDRKLCTTLLLWFDVSQHI